MSETYTTDSAEALAEALIDLRVPSPVEPDTEVELSGIFDWLTLQGIAQALIASGAVRRDAEVRAEALAPIRALLPGFEADYGVQSSPVSRLRAALAEEGGR